MANFIPVNTRADAVKAAQEYLKNNPTLRGGNLYILPNGQQLRVRPKGGGRLSAENYGTKAKADEARAESEKIPAYVQQLFEQYGQPDRYQEFVDYVKEGNRLQKQRTPVGFNVGHIGALSKGKPNVPSNRRLESASENQRRSDKDEPSDEALLVTGVPRTWQEAVINFLDPTGLPTELTPQDTQRIRGGEDPSLVFEQRADIIKGIRQKLANVNKVVNRFNAVETGLNLFSQGQTSSPVHQRVEQVARDVKPVIGGVQITGEPDPETDIGKQVGDMFKQFYQQLDNLAKQKPRYGEVPNLPNLK
jgi:hypothetical protein